MRRKSIKGRAKAPKVMTWNEIDSRFVGKKCSRLHPIYGKQTLSVVDITANGDIVYVEGKQLRERVMKQVEFLTWVSNAKVA